MFRMFRAFLGLLILSSAFLLAGCESREEKAERYFKSGMEYLEKGDEERALIEFQNVFQYNGLHKEARRTYADIKLRQGKVQEAYSQYLRLIEQYPDTADVRVILAELAIRSGNWEEAERHGREALRLTPEDPRARSVGVMLDYRQAVLAKDEAARGRVAAEAQTLLQARPDDDIARQVVLDNLLTGPDPMAAMPVLDQAIAADPARLDMQMTKLSLLARSGDLAAVGTQLKAMYGLFPDNAEVQGALIGWYMSQNDLDGAEAFLRQVAGEPTANPDRHAALIQFLQLQRGPEAARTELDALIAANQGNPNADLYASLRASLEFDAGRQTEAIEAVQAILKTAQPSDQTSRIKVLLATMLDTTGNAVGAQAAIEEVLAEDPSNVEALKRRAAWRIQADRPGEAIIDLRAALDQNPRDVQVLMLMADAHERDGSPDLAAERLAMAVEVSGAAPEPSLRYADFLIRQDRLAPAEKILLDARQASPGNAQILSMLGALQLRQKNWPGAQDTAQALDALGTPEAVQSAQAIRAAALIGQDRTEEGLAYLEEQAAAGTGGTAALSMLVQAQVRGGKLDEARQALEEALAGAPGDAGLRLMLATVIAMQGDTADAETRLRALVEEDPARTRVVLQLYGLLAAQEGRDADAAAVLEAGLAASPEAPDLLWTQAGRLEKAGDIDGAVAIYDRLYARDSSNVLIANNLASLIGSYTEDPVALQRAAAISRRLRDAEAPAFQDTYGWIAYRQGNFEEAVTYLEPAAAGLPDDLLTQIHYGLALAAAGQKDKAMTQLQATLDKAGDSTLPQLLAAREVLAAMTAGAPVKPPFVVTTQGTAATP